MSAPAIVRVCEYVECTNPLVKKPSESHTHFAARKYCSQACMGAARRKVQPAAAKAPRTQNGLNAAPPPTPLRYEAGVWRPNAPGWPATPRTPR